MRDRWRQRQPKASGWIVSLPYIVRIQVRGKFNDPIEFQSAS